MWNRHMLHPQTADGAYYMQPSSFSTLMLPSKELDSNHLAGDPGSPAASTVVNLNGHSVNVHPPKRCKVTELPKQQEVWTCPMTYQMAPSSVKGWGVVRPTEKCWCSSSRGCCHPHVMENHMLHPDPSPLRDSSMQTVCSHRQWVGEDALGCKHWLLVRLTYITLNLWSSSL